MKIRHTCFALVIIGSLSANFALAADKAAPQKMDPKMEAMMKKMEAAGTPGAAHKALEPLIGKWKVEVKTWMEPGMPPMVTKGKAEAEWVMNGRYVEEEFTGEMMGKPFHGMSLTGYDNLKREYSSVWIDDMSTSIFTSAGKSRDAGKVIMLQGKMACPMTDEKEMTMKQVIRIVSNDQHIFEMHDPSKGKNSKTMEITYTRK